MLDPNVLISAVLSPTGSPAALVARWLGGEFELVASELLLAELRRALTYPKLRARVTEEEARELTELIGRGATMEEDPAAPPRRSRDAGDDYLLALAEAAEAVLVTGDQDLLELRDVPVRSPAGFLEGLG